MANGEPLTPPTLLSKELDRNSFDRGVGPLNEYLRRYALQNQDKDAGRTYVATIGRRIIGYYTLVYGSVEWEEAPEKVRKGLAKYPVPILLLARLAVDLSQKGRGL